MGILNVDNLRAVGSGTSVTCLSNRLETTNINASGIITATTFSGNEIDTSSGNLTIDSAGGTTNITDVLNVTGSHVNLETGSASTQMQLRFGTNTEKSRITVVAATNDGYTGSTAGETVFNTNSQLSFSALGSQALTITSGRNIGIGRTDPGHKLAIHGGSSSQLEIKGTEADIWMTSTGPNGVWRILGSTGNNTHRFRIYDNTNGKEPFYIEGSSGTNTQHVHVNSGNLVFDASGTGINFAANTDNGGTATGTVLEDYEEGTYSSSIVSSNCTLDNSSATGYYIKVGNMVHVRGTFSLNTNDGSPAVSGSDGITQALPFPRHASGVFTGTMLQQNINWGGPTSLAHPHYFNPVVADYVCQVASDGLRFYMNRIEYAYQRLNNSYLHVGYPGYTSILWNITYQTT